MKAYNLEDIAPIKQGECPQSDYVWLLNLDMVESGTGDIIDYEYVELDKIGTSTVSFDTTNVLYSKLRPYLNKVVLPNRPGYATSEMVVLKPNPDVVTREYLTYFLRSNHFVEYINSKTTGAKMPRANIKALRQAKVPCPDLDTQNQIVRIFQKCIKIINARKKELMILDELVKARFVELFGNPVLNSKNLPLEKLSNLGELNRGVSKHRPRNAPELLNGAYPLIQTGDVANSDTYITRYSSTYSELGLRQSRLWPKETLCITIAANIAKTGILKFNACFPDSVVGFISGDKVTSLYIHYWFSFFQKILENQAPMSAQKNINLKLLSELNVMVPSLEVQAQFSVFIRQINKSKSVIQKSLDETQILFQSLMQEYFG